MVKKAKKLDPIGEDFNEVLETLVSKKYMKEDEFLKDDITISLNKDLMKIITKEARKQTLTVKQLLEKIVSEYFKK